MHISLNHIVNDLQIKHNSKSLKIEGIIHYGDVSNNHINDLRFQRDLKKVIWLHPNALYTSELYSRVAQENYRNHFSVVNLSNATDATVTRFDSFLKTKENISFINLDKFGIIKILNSKNMPTINIKNVIEGFGNLLERYDGLKAIVFSCNAENSKEVDQELNKHGFVKTIMTDEECLYVR